MFSNSAFDNSSNANMKSVQNSARQVAEGSDLRAFERFHTSSERSLSSSQLTSLNLKVYRYWEKKARRTSQKKVRYGCRQSLAKQRFRHQGRFITKEERDKLDPD